MIKTTLNIVLFLFLNFFSFSQNHYFHKVFKLPNQNSTRPYNIKQLDSVYYITGHVDGPGGVPVLFMKIDNDGDFVDIQYLNDTLNFDLAAYSSTKLDTNVNGNFMLHYRSLPVSGIGINQHERLEVNRTGQVVFKNTLDTFLVADMDCRDFGNLVLDNDNNVYYTADHFITDSAGYGIALTKFSQVNHTLLWMKKLYSSGPVNGIDKSKRTLLKYSNGDLLLIYNIIKGDYFSPLSQQFSKTIFERYDSSGSIIQQKIIESDPISLSGFGAKLVNNEKELVLCLTQSEILQTTSGWSYYGLTPSVVKLDSNFNIVWQENFGGAVYNNNGINWDRLINDFVYTQDNCIVYGGFYSEVNGGADTNKTTYLRLEKRDLNTGEQIWLRKIQYYNSLTPLYHPYYDIGDIENTTDYGFVLVGQVTNHDSIAAGKAGFLGYLLKTNCLGFLADPQAGFTSQNNDSLGVNFQNTSLMGGSYLWDFGDSTTLTTGENVCFDSAQPPIFHTYSDTGMYEVTLIAYGCNGANDTVKTTIHITKFNEPEPPINPNIVNYMALGPNPVKCGESIAVYVGNLPSENCWLSFYDYQGKLVLERAIPQDKSTYIIVLPFSAGVYQAFLRDGEKKLEVEKVMVQ